ncbi:MAG: hypothetical protein ACI9DH_000551 [Halioglobus sp.]|jgi:hypothetical protein
MALSSAQISNLNLSPGQLLFVQKSTFFNPVVSASTLNSQRTISEITANVVAENQPIPLVYGHAQVGGKPFAIDYTEGVFTIGYVACLGEINGFLDVWINGAALPAGVSVNYYTGTTAQTADPLLSAAITDYTDTLVISDPAGDIGIAYIVIQYADTVLDSWPRVVIELEGKKVWNPKTSTTIYSENPALHLGDILSSVIYGQGKTVDDTDLEATQDAADDAVFGEIRRQSYLVIDQPQDTDSWVQILRAYAACFIVYRTNAVHLIPDVASSSVMSITASDIVENSIKITKLDSGNFPTVVRVSYTDTTGVEWRERLSDPAEAAGVAAGTTQRRESRVRLNGIDRHSQAYREAVERRNKLALSDLRVEWTMFDEGQELEAGKVVDITHPYGLTAKLLRITSDPVESSPGRWRLSGSEYDPAAYSNEIATQPSYTDGDLPTTGAPDAVAGLTVGETTYQLINGEYASRLDISWTASTGRFVTGYNVVVKDGPTAIYGPVNVSDSSLATPALLELVSYTIEVKAYTPLLIGTAASANYSIIGKTAIPDAPASISGFEVGGEARLRWVASTDVDAKRYEVRYGTTAQAWDDAATIDIVDGLRLTTKDVPPGTWRFHVKTIDSIFQYSTTAATVDFVVTLDDDAFRAGGLDPVGDGATKTYIHSIEEIRGSGATEHYSDGADTWATLFSGAAMSTFTDSLASYQTAQGTSYWYSEELDLGEDKSGAFVGAKAYTDHSGTASLQLGLKPAGGSYTWGNLSQNGTARYAQLRISSAGIFQTETPQGSITADVVAREEVGSGTSSSTVATTITLTNDYSAVRSINIIPEGTTALTAVYDNISLGSPTTFDVYVFDSAGTQVANLFRYSWKGV